MQPYGMQSMLKEGHKHLSGLDEAVLKNIDACKQLSAITRTSLGPNGTSHLFLDPLLFWVFAFDCLTFQVFVLCHYWISRVFATFLCFVFE
jgi:hypothetical protein